MSYEKLYLLLYAFAHYEVYGYPLCQIVGLIIPFPFLITARLTSSAVLKILAIPIGMLFFSLPYVVSLFADVLK
jgi:hypothetical protein